jgi:hypothetical protein
MLSFSPTPRGPVSDSTGVDKENNANKLKASTLSKESSTLICAKFQEILVLDFGHINNGTMKSMKFELKNPSNQKEIVISVAKIPKKNGVSMVLGHDCNEETATIPPDSSVPGMVYWNPIQNNSKMREVIGLKMDGKSPLQITVQGICGNPELPVSCFVTRTIFDVL